MGAHGVSGDNKQTVHSLRLRPMLKAVVGGWCRRLLELTRSFSSRQVTPIKMAPAGPNRVSSKDIVSTGHIGCGFDG